MTTQSALEAIRHTLMTGLAHNAAIAALDRVRAALHPAQHQGTPTVEQRLDGARWLMNQHWITVEQFRMARAALERGEE